MVSCSETATFRFRFTGTNAARQPTVFAFLLERCALQAFSRFLADYNRKYCAFFNQGNAVFEVLIQKIKHNYVQRTGLARLKAIARVSILSL